MVCGDLDFQCLSICMSVNFAVVGAGRGRTFVQSARSLADKVSLMAVCDTSPSALEPWQNDRKVRLYTSFDALLENPEVDAVCIATPAPLHGRQAIQALRAGKHVLSEVIATYSIEEGHELIQAAETSRCMYMMAENYCFMRDVLMVQNMVDLGIFGDLVFASGSYIHDCRGLFFSEDGEPTWRGDLRKNLQANSYPTHALGPVCRWLGINRTDSLETTASWQSRSRAVSHFTRRNHPQHSALHANDQWVHPDTVTSMIRTRNGVLIESRNDWASARPHHMMRYELQGTRAAFCSSEDPLREPLVWIEGRSPTSALGEAEQWEPLYKYAEEFEHPLWREHGEAAVNAGHGGGDYFVLREFLQALQEKRAPMVDVYDAVTWSSLAPLSAQSIAKGNVPVKVPDFCGKRRIN